MKASSKRYAASEAFVREALQQIESSPVDDAVIKAVAKKVSRAVPPYPVKQDTREEVAA